MSSVSPTTTARIETFLRVRPLSASEIQQAKQVHRNNNDDAARRLLNPAVDDMELGLHRLAYDSKATTAGQETTVALEFLKSTTCATQQQSEAADASEMQKQHCVATFDGILNPDNSAAGNDHIFQTLGIPLVEHALRSENSALFFFGPRGTGRHTTCYDSKLIHRVFEQILARRNELLTCPEQSRIITVSAYDIQFERVLDIGGAVAFGRNGIATFSSDHNFAPLKCRATGVYGGERSMEVTPENLTRLVIDSVDEFSEWLERVRRRRLQLFTHCGGSNRLCTSEILQIQVARINSSQQTVDFSTISFVIPPQSNREPEPPRPRFSPAAASTNDLQQRTFTTGKKYAATLSLISVIRALATNGGRFIPYRDSKLTHLFSFALGGSCFTRFVFTASQFLPPPPQISGLGGDATNDVAVLFRLAGEVRQIQNRNPLRCVQAKLSAWIEHVVLTAFMAHDKTATETPPDWKNTAVVPFNSACPVPVAVAVEIVRRCCFVLDSKKE